MSWPFPYFPRNLFAKTQKSQFLKTLCKTICTADWLDDPFFMEYLDAQERRPDEPDRSLFATG